jgi:hypothetical protein
MSLYRHSYSSAVASAKSYTKYLRLMKVHVYANNRD